MLAHQYRTATIDGGQLPLFLTVEEAARVLGLGRSATYDAIRRGEIHAVTFGRKLRVPRGALLALGMVQGGGADAG